MQGFAINKFMRQGPKAFLRIVMQENISLGDFPRFSKSFSLSRSRIVGEDSQLEQERYIQRRKAFRELFPKRLDFLFQSHEIYNRTILPLTRINMILWNLWNFVFLIFIPGINVNPILRNWIRSGNDFKREISLESINIGTRKFSAARNLAELNIK